MHKLWYCVSGTPYGRSMGNATAGSTYNYRLRYYAPSSGGGYIWRIDINLTEKEEQVITFEYGRPKGGAERDNDGAPENYTTNYAHEWNLMRREAPGSDPMWTAWTNLAGSGDTDPRFSIDVPNGADWFYVTED